MAYGDYFKDIDFDKEWDEADWERFFAAQDRVVREAGCRPAARPSRPGDARLPFREVLRRFGMDPDNAFADEDLSQVEEPDRGAAAPSPAASFTRDDAPLEGLPIYGKARAFAGRVLRLCDGRLARVMSRSYKSRSHRRLQELLTELRVHAIRIPGAVAAGHALGYEPDAILGNVVRCRTALVEADECLGRISRISSRRFPAAERQRLFQENLRLRNGLRDWIALLRDRAGRRVH